MLGQTRVVTTALAATLISLSLCFGAEAQTVTLGQFQHPAGAKDLEFNKAYLLGALNGLLAFNAASDDKQFCLPGLIPKLTFEETNDVVIRWARKTSGSTDITLGQALMFSLKAAYPCRG